MRTVLLCLAFLVCLGSAASAEAGPRLSTLPSVINAIEHARTVTLSAYTLPTRGAFFNALLDASRRHGVSIMLDGQPVGNVRSVNAQLAQTFSQAGARVRFSNGPLHMKAAVIDGTTVFVSDRNWSRGALVLALPSEDRLAVERAILGQAENVGPFSTRKADALTLEAEVLKRGSGPISIETESFGPNVVSQELEAEAHRGVAVTLIVAGMEYRQSQSEQRFVEHLKSEGIHVIVSEASEKIAVRGGLGWVGSANQTAALPDQIDFGLATNDPTVISGLRKQLAANAASGSTGERSSSTYSRYPRYRRLLRGAYFSSLFLRRLSRR